jgi:hypothetical protein
MVRCSIAYATNHYSDMMPDEDNVTVLASEESAHLTHGSSYREVRGVG